MVSNGDLLRENMRVAAESEDTGTLQALKALDSLESKINQVQVAYQQFYTTIGIETYWKIAADAARNFIDSLNGLPKVFDAIPVGAITVIMDAVSLIKGVALQGFASIASMFKDTLNQMEGDAQSKGPQIGQTTANAINEGYQQAQAQQQAPEVITTEQVENAKQKAEEIKSALSSIAAWEGVDLSTFSHVFEQYQTETDSVINNLQNLGYVTKEVAEELKNMTPEAAAQRLRELGIEASATADKLSAMYQEAQNANTFMSKMGTWFTNNQNKVTSFAMGLNMLANFMNNGSEASKRFSGAMMSVSGAISLGMGALVTHNPAQIIRGIITLISGFSTMVEDNTEKLERLTKEAENLSNEAKQVKAEYSTIQRTANKLDELKAKRYESIEAEEEYQSALQELGEKLPRLITSTNDLGEITVDVSSLEDELARMREASAEATEKAIAAEKKKVEQEITNQKEEVDSLYSGMKRSGQRYADEGRDNGAFGEENDIYEQLFKEYGGHYSDSRGRDPGQELLTLLNDYSLGETGLQFNGETLEYWIENYEKAFAAVDELFGKDSDYAKLYYSYFSDNNNNIAEGIASRIETLFENAPDDPREFLERAKEIQQDIVGADLTEAFATFIEDINALEKGIKTYDDLLKTVAPLNIQSIEAAIDRLDEAKTSFIKDNAGADTLLTMLVDQRAKEFARLSGEEGTEEYTKAYNEFLASNKDVEDAVSEFSANITEEQLKLIAAQWDNLDQFSLSDWLEMLQIDDNSLLASLLTAYFNKYRPVERITKSFESKFAGQNASADFNVGELSQNQIAFLSNGDALYNEYLKSGYDATANALYEGLKTVISATQALDPATEGPVSALLKDMTYTSEGIEETITKLEQFKGTDDLRAALTDLSDGLIQNLPLAIQTYVATAKEQLEDIEKQLKKASTGFSASELYDAIALVNADGGEEISADDGSITVKNGKYYFSTAELRKRYQLACVNDLSKENKKLNASIEAIGESSRDINLLKTNDVVPLEAFANNSLVETLKDIGVVTVDAEKKTLQLTDEVKELTQDKSFDLVSYIYDILLKQLAEGQTTIDYVNNILVPMLNAEQWQTERDNLANVAKEIASGVNSTVSAETAAILTKAGYTLSSIEGTTNFLITGMGDVTAAWRAYRETLIAKDQATIEQLNELNKNLLTSGERGSEARAIELLGKATKMSLSDFADILTQEGIELSEEVLEGFKRSGIVTELGSGQIRVNYERFAEKMGWDFDSEEYLSGLKTYNDALVSLNDKVEKDIKEEIESLTSAKRGEAINLTNTYNSIIKAFDELVSENYDDFYNRFATPGYNGNVDLTNRKIISGKKMRRAGWNEFTDDSYATLYSSGFTVDNTLVELTPILKSGKVLSPRQLDAYVDDLIKYTDLSHEQIMAYDKAHKNICLNAVEMAEGMTEADVSIGYALHEGQEAWDKIRFAQEDFENQLAALGADWDNGVLLLSDNADQIGITKLIADKAVELGRLSEDKADEIYDAYREMLDALVTSITDGIKGTLTKSGASQLAITAKNRYNVDLDFTETVEGLKMSEKSARDLYLALRNVDSMRAQLVFSELDASLKKTNENYKNISTVTARIAQLERKLANPKISTKRREEYEKELEVAKEIQETRSLTDEGDFNYMDRSLPTGMQNPIDYWQGTYSAFEAMNKAAESGHMSINDFYNIVNELNNTAKITGKSLYLMGYELNGSATSASKLIQMGMNNISNIDGEGPMIDLGNQFLNGAQGMSNGIDKSAREMAKSQIEMLDAMIAFLEVVVAMENFEGLDKDKDGLEFEEMFNDLGNGFAVANDDAAAAAQNVLDLAKKNKDLDAGLKTVIIDGKSVKTRLKELANQTVITTDEAEKTQRAYAAMLEAAKTGDFSTKNLSQLLAEAFKGVDEVTEIQVGDRKFAIKGETVIETNDSGEYVVDGIRTRDPEEAIKAKKFKEVEGVLNAHTSVNGETGEEFFVGSIPINSQINVTVKENIETGEKTYEVNGYSFDNRSDAIRYAVNSARGNKTDFTPGANAGDLTEEEIIEYDLVAKFNLTAAEVANLTGKPIGELSDDMLKELGLDTALIYSIQAAVERALAEINLGEMLLNGLLGVTDKDKKAEKKLLTKALEAGITEEDFKKTQLHDKMAAVGYYLGTGIVEAMKRGISDTIKTGDEENPGSVVTDEITSGMEDGEGDVSTTAEQLASALKAPFAALVGGEGESDSLMKQYGLTAIQSFLDGFSMTDANGESALSEVLAKQVFDPIEYALTGGDNFEIMGMTAAEQFVAGFAMDETSDENSFGELFGTRLTAPIRKALSDLFTKETLDELVKHFKTNSDIVLEFSKLDVGKLSEAAQSVESAVTTTVAALNTLSTSIGKIESKEVTFTAKVEGKARSTMIAHVESNGAVSLTADAGSPVATAEFTQTYGNAQAKGNAKKTLMGELGPELVVSGGRYYVVGQNGAEMVDLPDDAIVFNHLQTKQLLANGSAGRGEPVTNEYKAVAYATGTTGPAMATAKETLELLKQIRAMWQAMLSASSKQLGALVGKSAKEDDDKDNEVEVTDDEGRVTTIKRTTADIQRWYNLMRQIDKTEKDIAYQESLVSKYQSDRITNGHKIYMSYKTQLKMLEANIERERELSTIQKDWYDKKRAELAASEYGLIFTYTEDGLQQYEDGRGRGLDILEKLNAEDVYGRGKGASSNVKAQLDYLQSIGFGLNNLMAGMTDQNLSYVGSSDYMVDLEGNVLQGDDLENARASLMQVFWDKVDGWRDELDSLYDTYRENEEKLVEAQQQANELLQTIVDNQIEVENTLLDAVTHAREEEINELQKTRDAYEKSSNKMVTGLTKALTAEREGYQSQQDKNELTKLQRQLAILQRSGGSASQIRSLQDQITSKQQDLYFDEREKQIKEIEDAANKQIELMDEQIDLMTETLEYQKENGLLWNTIADIMSKDEDTILDYIVSNGEGWESKSITQKEEEIRSILEKIQQWTDQRDDIDELKAIEKALVDTNENDNTFHTSDEQRSTSEVNTAATTKRKLYTDSEMIQPMLNPSTVEIGEAVFVGDEYLSGTDATDYNKYLKNARLTHRYANGGPLPINYTGPIWVDGTPSKPEYILNNDQMTSAAKTLAMINKLRDIWSQATTIDNFQEQIRARAAELDELYDSYHNSVTENKVDNSRSNQGDTVYIDNLDFNMNVAQLSNSYDARQAGKDVVDEIMRIAKKSGSYNGLSRR